MNTYANTYVLGFSGRIASGKSTLSAAVADALEVPRVSFGDYVRHLAGYMGLDADERVVLQGIGRLLAEHPREFCAKVLAQGGYQAGQPLVIDGIRHMEIAEEIRVQVAPAELKLIYVEAEETTIKARLSQGGKHRGDIRRLELDPTEVQVRTTVRGQADINIRTDEGHTLEDMVDEVVRWLRDLPGVG